MLHECCIMLHGVLHVACCCQVGPTTYSISLLRVLFFAVSRVLSTYYAFSVFFTDAWLDWPMSFPLEAFSRVFLPRTYSFLPPFPTHWAHCRWYWKMPHDLYVGTKFYSYTRVRNSCKTVTHIAKSILNRWLVYDSFYYSLERENFQFSNLTSGVYKSEPATRVLYYHIVAHKII